MKDGVHQTKGWSNSGKDNNNDNDIIVSFLYIIVYYCTLAFTLIHPKGED